MAIESVRPEPFSPSYRSAKTGNHSKTNASNSLQIEPAAPRARGISKLAYGATVALGALGSVAALEGGLIGGLLPGVTRDTRACALQACVPTDDYGAPTDGANTGWGPSQAGGPNYPTFSACMAAFSPSHLLSNPERWQDPVDWDDCFNSPYSRLIVMTTVGLVGGLLAAGLGAWVGMKIAQRFAAKPVAEDNSQSV